MFHNDKHVDMGNLSKYSFFFEEEENILTFLAFFSHDES